MSDSIRDRIARALVKSDCDRRCCDMTWDQITPEGKEAARNDADAVLAVLRDPSDEDVETVASLMADVTGEPGAGRFERTMARAAINLYLGSGEA